MNITSEDDLLHLFDALDARNQRLGWKRYDLADIESHRLLLQAGTCWRPILRRVVRGMDAIMPFLVHAVMQVKPQLVPTAFYHVGMSYLLRERLPRSNWPAARADEVCELALGARDVGERAWSHPYVHHASGWCKPPDMGRRESCAHHTARVGLLFSEVGVAHSRSDFIEAAVDAAQALVADHHWHFYKDSCCSISYYPHSEDETINTCVDVAALFASLPQPHLTQDLERRVSGLVATALAEQRDDGSWTYCTRRHYQRTGDTPSVDNHHTAQVLQGLTRVYSSGILAVPVNESVGRAIRAGMRFYLTRFYARDGKGTHFPSPKRRRSHIVGYSEGIAALYWYLSENLVEDGRERQQVSSLIPAMLSHAIAFCNRKADVASEIYFRIPYHIRSLRWGSGPLMEALIYSLLAITLSENSRIGTKVPNTAQ